MARIRLAVLLGCALVLSHVGGATAGEWIGPEDWLSQPCESERDPYEEPIETDRHDFTKTTKTVGRGVFQIEGGYTYFYKDENEEIEQTHVLPELLLRYGLTDNVEVQVRWNYAWRFPEGEDHLDGAEDLRLALKVGLWEQEEWLPETTAYARMTAPTGGTAWTTESVEVGGQVIYAWELGENWELAGTTGGFTNGAGDVGFQQAELGRANDFVVWAQSLALRVPVSENVNSYLEWFGFWTDGLEEERIAQYFNIGVDVLLTHNLVIDFRLGKGLTADAEDFFGGVGGGIRF